MSDTMTARPLVVQHVELRNEAPVETVHKRLLATLPRLAPSLITLESGEVEAVERQRRAGPSLWLFEVHDMGAFLEVERRTTTICRYEIGDPLTAESMLRHQPGAGLYTPLQVVPHEDGTGSAFSCDRPSNLFGQFGDNHVTAVGHELDRELEAALRRALQTR